MKVLRTTVCLTVAAASLALTPMSESHAQVAVVSPGVAVAQPVYRPLFPGAWWRRQMRRMTFSPLTPVAAAPVATFPFTTTAARITTFSPVLASPGNCTTCCPTQQCFKVCEPRTTCRYVPQTCFRTEQIQVPVTTMRPVTTVDPCTGCTTTCMRPQTTMVCQTRQVPYTTYRMVCSTVNVERTVCRQAMSCSSCPPAIAPAAYAAPAPAAAPCATCPTHGAAQVGSPTAQPRLEAPPQPEPTESFRPETPPQQPQGNGASHTPTKEIKSTQEQDPAYSPLDPPFPSLQDKLTESTSPPRVSLVTLPAPQADPAPAGQLDDSGWHAAGR